MGSGGEQCLLALGKVAFPPLSRRGNAASSACPGHWSFLAVLSQPAASWACLLVFCCLLEAPLPLPRSRYWVKWEGSGKKKEGRDWDPKGKNALNQDWMVIVQKGQYLAKWARFRVRSLSVPLTVSTSKLEELSVVRPQSDLVLMMLIFSIYFPSRKTEYCTKFLHPA